MAYTNSSLVTYTNTNHKHFTAKRSAIKGVILHHMAGVMTGKGCADYFASTTRQVSSNYCIGYNGDIALCVEEKYRAWTTGGYDPDGYYVTIEVSNTDKTTYKVSDATIRAAITLIADIYKRNGIEKCIYGGTKSTSNLMKHQWYASTYCPGDYLGNQFPYIASEVNKLLAADEIVETEPDEDQGKILYVTQCGAFSSKANAEKLVMQLWSKGISSVIKVRWDVTGDGVVDINDARELLRRVTGQEAQTATTQATQKGDEMFLVQAGAFSKKANASALAKTIKSAGFSAVVKVKDDIDGDGDVDIADARELLRKVISNG